MVRYGGNDYGHFFEECTDSDSLRELQTALDSGMTRGNVNDKFGLYSTHSGVWVTDRETRSQSRVALGAHGRPNFMGKLEEQILIAEDFEEVRDDPLTKFIVDYFHDAEEVNDLLDAYLDPWNGCGRPSSLEEVMYGEFAPEKFLLNQNEEDVILVTPDSAIFNITQYSGDHKSMIERAMKQYFTYGMEFDDYFYFETCSSSEES